MPISVSIEKLLLLSYLWLNVKSSSIIFPSSSSLDWTKSLSIILLESVDLLNSYLFQSLNNKILCFIFFGGFPPFGKTIVLLQIQYTIKQAIINIMAINVIKKPAFFKIFFLLKPFYAHFITLNESKLEDDEILFSSL